MHPRDFSACPPYPLQEGERFPGGVLFLETARRSVQVRLVEEVVEALSICVQDALDVLPLRRARSGCNRARTSPATAHEAISAPRRLEPRLTEKILPRREVFRTSGDRNNVGIATQDLRHPLVDERSGRFPTAASHHATKTTSSGVHL